MGSLTNDQLERLREFLINQKLTFKPLLEEMIDHVSCDLEERLDQGMSFEEALRLSMNNLPDNHFYTLQKQTMQTIDKQFTLSRRISYVTLGLIFISIIFKIFHLQGTGEVLLLSFVTLAISLSISSFSGVYLNKEKKGGFRVIAVIIGTFILMTGYSFKIMHLPGADSIIIVAVGVLISALFINTIFVYRNASGEGNLLTFLHEKYTPGIERFLLILLFPITLYKVIALLTQADNFIGGLILIVVIFGSGLQFFALTWRAMEKNLSHRKPAIVSALTISFLSFMLVFLGNVLQLEIRVVLVMIFTSVSAWLAYQINDKSNKPASLVVAILIPIIFLGWALVKLSIISSSINGVIFNIPILLILSAAIFVCRKNTPMRTYLLISLSSYIFEYTVN